MSWPVVNFLLNVLGLLVLPLLFFVWRNLEQVRSNELSHLQATLDRVEEKLDAHLLWHADRH